MSDIKHLLDSLDGIGEPEAWCGAMFDCSEYPSDVTCVTCLENFMAQSRLVETRLAELKEKGKAEKAP